MTADSKRSADSKRAADSKRGADGKRKSPLSNSEIARRMVGTGVFAGGLLLGSLGIGILGYHHFARLRWLDALANASMILGGMGPLDPITTDAGKWFASIYALYSGIILLGSAGVFFSPLIHRFLHTLHLDVAEDEES
jgi:hypothetical protein